MTNEIRTQSPLGNLVERLAESPEQGPSNPLPEGTENAEGVQQYGNRRTHGMSGTLEYVTWTKMLSRCTNPHANNYARYGGRGITVCAEWAGSFQTFLADMGPRPSAEHSIERKDNTLGYSKTNCRWATRTEQGANKRNNIAIEFRGRKQILAVWCRELGLHYNITRQRLNREKWSVERALTTPTNKP